MSHSPYDDEVEFRWPAPAPAVIWGALMAVALIGAGATVLRAPRDGGPKLVASATDDRAVERDVALLTAERNELAGRLASLERSVGEIKLASRPGGVSDTTGSVSRAAASAEGKAETKGETKGETRGETRGFGLSLGPDASYDAIRRRWTALSARYPQQLGKLAPRAQRSAGSPNVFDLVAGPFATRADADRACVALAEQGLACDTTAYAGDPIGRP